MPTIELTRDLPAAQGGHQAGYSCDVTDDVAKIYIEKGFARLKPAPPPAELPRIHRPDPSDGLPRLPGHDGAAEDGSDVLSAISEAVGKAYEAGVRTAEAGSKGGRPDVVRLLASAGREAKPESRSTGEWLWCVGHSTPSYAGSHEGQKAVSLMANKYKSRFNGKFAEEWEKAYHLDHAGKASVQVETSGPLGGFTVPVEFYNEIIKLAYEESILFSRVRKYPMNGLQLNIPAIDYSKGAAGASPYLAGMVASWFAEGTAFTQTNISLRQIELKANLLGGYTQASRTLMADNAVGLQQVLTEMMGMTISFYVTNSIINGTGVGQPRGILNEAAAIKVVKTGDSTAGTTLADFAAMRGKLLPGSEKRALWMIDPSTFGYLLTMADKSGRVVYLPNFPGTQSGPAGSPGMLQIFGIPVEVNQYAAANAGVGDILLIDPAAYAWGERQDIEIGVSEHVAFLSNLLTWRFLFRGDGHSKINTYLTLASTSTVSPFVYRAPS